jgi:hypothetical protein
VVETCVQLLLILVNEPRTVDDRIEGNERCKHHSEGDAKCKSKVGSKQTAFYDTSRRLKARCSFCKSMARSARLRKAIQLMEKATAAVMIPRIISPVF